MKYKIKEFLYNNALELVLLIGLIIIVFCSHMTDAEEIQLPPEKISVNLEDVYNGDTDAFEFVKNTAGVTDALGSAVVTSAQAFAENAVRAILLEYGVLSETALQAIDLADYMKDIFIDSDGNILYKNPPDPDRKSLKDRMEELAYDKAEAVPSGWTKADYTNYIFANNNTRYCYYDVTDGYFCFVGNALVVCTRDTNPPMFGYRQYNYNAGQPSGTFYAWPNYDYNGLGRYYIDGTQGQYPWGSSMKNAFGVSSYSSTQEALEAFFGASGEPTFNGNVYTNPSSSNSVSLPTRNIFTYNYENINRNYYDTIHNISPSEPIDYRPTQQPVVYTPVYSDPYWGGDNSINIPDMPSIDSQEFDIEPIDFDNSIVADMEIPPFFVTIITIMVVFLILGVAL